MTTDGVDLVDEHDARRIFLCLLEHIAHARGTDTDKHFHKVGTGDREKGHFGFAGNSARQQGFTGTWRAHHQHAAGNASAQLLEFGRVAQEIHQFGNFFFGLIATCDVNEGDRVGAFVEHLRAAFAERKCAATSAALHLAHEINPHADQQQHRE